MLKLFWKLITKNAGLKILALILALVLWFYVVDELNKGSLADRQFLNKVLPSGGVDPSLAAALLKKGAR